MVVDARDLEITLDSHVRYVDTGTVGKVLDIKTENERGWVKLDKTELWYLANRVELLDEKDIKKSRWGENNEVTIEDLKEKASEFDSFELATDAGNGGG
ncbi:DUF2098 domain-containing protein [Methanobrevibacter sp.]